MTKRWWQSKGVIGGIAALSGSMLEIAQVLNIYPNPSPEIEQIQAWLIFGGSLLAIYGRVTAKSEVTL